MPEVGDQKPEIRVGERNLEMGIRGPEQRPEGRKRE